jgi:hypothetical protein
MPYYLGTNGNVGATRAFEERMTNIFLFYPYTLVAIALYQIIHSHTLIFIGNLDFQSYGKDLTDPFVNKWLYNSWTEIICSTFFFFANKQLD